MDPDLREVHLGDWEGGKFRIMVHENHPLYVKMHEEQRWDVIPGAESREALQERIGRGLNRIAQAHPNELVVAVLHGGVIGHIIAEASGSTPFAFNGCDNGSISRSRDGRWENSRPRVQRCQPPRCCGHAMAVSPDLTKTCLMTAYRLEAKMREIT